MKKFMKKLCSLVILLGLIVSCIPINSYAAEGSLQFSDPKCAAGENVDVNVKVLSTNGNIGNYELNISYDPAMLQFVSGDGATGGDGSVKITHNGDGGAETLNVISFKALDNGSASVKVNSYNAALTSGEELNLALGEATVTIEGGTPVSASESGSEGSSEAPVEAESPLEVVSNNEKYTIYEDFPDKEVPEGFEKVTVDHKGITVNAFKHIKSGQIVFYGASEVGENIYLFEDESTKNISPAVLVPINSTLNIMVMDAPAGEKMPEHIMPTTMTLNGKKFKIYNNIDNQDYYYIYAFSSNGTLGYYQYDSVEQTYQRANKLEFVEEEVVVEEEKNPLIGFVENYLVIIIVSIAVILLILIIVIIILSVKLAKRPKNKSYDEEITDDVNDYDENDVYDVDFDDYDDGDEHVDESDESDEADEAMDEYFEDIKLEFEDDMEDLPELEVDDDFGVAEESAEKQRGRNDKKSNDDDDFSIDFIEL